MTAADKAACYVYDLVIRRHGLGQCVDDGDCRLPERGESRLR